MLRGLATKYGSGLGIFGDWYDLKDAYECVHRVSDSPGVDASRQKDYMIALAYDFRKAYERQREEKKFGFDEYDTVQYRGVKVIWTYFLSQLALLRYAAGFMSTSRRDQATLYLLEALAEQTLASKDAGVARQCMAILPTIVFPEGYLYSFIDVLTHEFVLTRPKDRLRSLPALLRSMDPISERYIQFRDQARQKAMELDIKPEEIGVGEDLPDFKW
jgi:hypothetical protein